MLNINDFNIQREWDYSPNSLKYIEPVIKELIEFGVMKESDVRQREIVSASISCCSYFWPFGNDEQMRIGGSMMSWLLFFDDPLDSNKYEEKDCIEMVKRTEYIFLTRQLPCNPTNLEKYTLFIIERSRVRITNSSQNTNIYKKGQCWVRINMDLAVWGNPIYQKLIDLASYHVSYINDAVSVCKEMKNGDGDSNLFLIIMKRLGGIEFIKEAYKQLTDEANGFVEEFCFYEKLFLSNLSIEQQKEMELFITHLKYLMKGNQLWSPTTPRYAMEDHPIIQLRRSTNKLIDNNVNMNNISSTNKNYI
ncbi:hypothetical protein ACTFIU_006773 [Dictyostelium citrinum]